MTRRNTLGLFLLGAAGILAPVAPAVAAPPEPTEAASAVIVQARDLAAARQAVLEAGGDVTHELGIIRAVGAELTGEQRAALEVRSDGVRVYADAEARVDSTTCDVAGGYRLLESKVLLWHLSNRGTAAAAVSGIYLEWPSANGVLKKIKLDGDEIHAEETRPPTVTLTSGWHDDASRRRIEAGETLELELEFDDDVSFTESNYKLFVSFAEGCVVEFQPSDTSCMASGLGWRELKGDKLKWEITNIGTGWITLDSLSLNWPESNGYVKKVKLGGGGIYEQEIQPPVTTLVEDDWKGNIDDRWIEPGKSEELELEFTEDIDLADERYSIIAGFAEGCSVEFAPQAWVVTEDSKARDTKYPTLVGAAALHARGVTGRGVTVAVLDTGLWKKGNGIEKDAFGEERMLAAYDAVAGQIVEPKDAEDHHGHGSHVASIIVSSRRTSLGRGNHRFNGVAPNAGLVVIKAFDEEGRGRYADVIRGVQFVVDHRDLYGIRVLNLSLSAAPRSHYWDDPLNQAVMAAWQAGIVVVASAGNDGPDPMTVGVPGNLPYVITVGAMSDGVTPEHPGDDFVTTFSSAGPTFEGFVKPDLIAPGGHVLGVMDSGSRIPKRHPRFHDGDSYYYMSGTSQATAVVSGLAALLLEAEPTLSPDDVKCRLMATARPALDAQSDLAYSLFQQGAGLADVEAAAEAAFHGCANRGLDLDADLADRAHFRGRANRRSDGTYYLDGLEGGRYLWSGAFVWSDGLVWSDAFIWSDAFVWSDAFLWSDAFVWSDAFLWSDAFVGFDAFIWSDGLAEPAAINHWVDQQ